MANRTSQGSLTEAFFSVCSEAKPAAESHVSLYCAAPYYGGPEEGGWWGEDVTLCASQCFNSDEAAEAARAAVLALAEKLNLQARTEFGQQCQAETAWLESRGLDDSFLPEVSGQAEYFVRVEDVAGASASQGCRHYE